VQTSATPELSLAMSRGKRFESARRLSRNITICRKIVEFAEGLGTVLGPLYCNRTATRSAEGDLHGVGSLLAHAWQEVRVGAQREFDVRVAQELLHELRVHTLGEEDRGTGMP
jgi:hypothetical protein